MLLSLTVPSYVTIVWALRSVSFHFQQYFVLSSQIVSTISWAESHSVVLRRCIADHKA